MSHPLPHLPRWVAAFARRRAPRARAGLYLWGGVGRGKTFLMDLFYASLPPGVGRRRHFHRFMQEVHLRLAALAQQQQRNPLEAVAGDMAREHSVLCLDELYVADIADAMILGGWFAALFRRGVTLVATSNLAPRELYRDGLQRQRFVPAIELLESRLEVLHIGGDTDYRLRQLTAAGTYLPAGAADSAARLAALFALLAGGDGARGGSIEIAGRAIELLRVAPGVVWFAFAALCGGPRSVEDYIEIAREYQSVLVSDGTSVRRRARGRGAPLHRPGRRALRSQRKPGAVGGGRPAGAVSRGAARRVVCTHRESPDRDAERGVPRARAPCLNDALRASRPDHPTRQLARFSRAKVTPFAREFATVSASAC